jgi:Tfp pilus assembly protein PilV
MRGQARCSRVSGFSLIEALIAAVILAVVLATTAGGLSMAFRFVTERRLRAIADTVCQSHMEMLLAIERQRNLQASDCQPVRYTREVIGADDAIFVATCTIIPNRPVTPTASYDRLVVEVTVPFEGREIKTSYSTYVVHR